MSKDTPAYKRILLKLSGEALQGAQNKSLHDNYPVDAILEAVSSRKAKLEEKYQKKCVIERNITALKMVSWQAVVLEELLENAFKFHPGNTLLVYLTIKEHSIEFADDGPGIPPEEQDKVFEPFHQVYRDFTGNIPGIGLGLTLVKKLVELNKGTIEIESTIGKGTKFKIHF